ncbi:thioredoxin [Lysobacter daejeonensis GH1-9]|uniref:Thioredoxin n=1 Tax=Lysobacter daejeonensis GH1-9 TaxID=1385517 RepID=A0A0A0EWC0_9GAMM|nr:thioredoxin TrxC [Lysobacter daejeonensis]KGM55281.1 thioredoxin [Lysobacter daejeonensis GH1-9]
MSEALHIACPHCHALNRVPPERLGEAPACGRCHRALFDAHPVELGVDHFAIHYTRSDLPLLVDFWAPWCGPCQVMAPHFAQAAALLEPRVRLAKVNTQNEPTLGQQFGIRSIPTLALFHHGRELARQAGAMATADIVRWTQQHLVARA